MLTKPDDGHMTPIPKIMDVGTFHARFGTDEGCLEHLKPLRCGADLKRFTCPDYDTGRVVWMGEGRRTVTIDEFFEAMPTEVREGIEAVAIDMWEPYIKAVKRWCPQADVVFDLFHVVKAFNKVRIIGTVTYMTYPWHYWRR